MKKITLFFLLLTAGFSYSQVVVENFDGATSPTVNGFEGLGSVSVIADTSPGGALGNVMEIVSSSSGQGWQGAELLFQNNFIDLTSTITVDVDVYSTTPFSMLAKVEDKVNNTAPASAANQSHTGSGWETMTFTFNESLDGTSNANGEYSQIAFFPNWNGAGWNTPPGDFTILVDQISAVLGSAYPVSYDLMEDFDGTAPTLNVFEGMASATIVPDPTPGMALGNVAELVSSSSGQGWQGAELIMQSNFMDLSSNLVVEVDVYSTTAFTILAKVEDKVNNTAPASAAAQSHGGSGWESLSFTFNQGLDGTGTANGEYSQIAFFPNWNGAGWNTPPADLTFYIDEVRSTLGSMIGSIPAPSTAAPIPTDAVNDVLSIYGDTNGYTNWMRDYTFGSDGGEIDLDPSAGVNNARIFNLAAGGYGEGTNPGSVTDVSLATSVKFDYWADSNSTSFYLDLIEEDGSVQEYFYRIGSDGTNPQDEAITTGSWVSVEIPMTFFTNQGFSADKFFQWKIDALSDLLSEFVYIDNLRFVGTGLSTNDVNSSRFTASPNPTSSNWNIASTATITKITVYDILGKQVSISTPNDFQASIDATSLKSGVYFARVESESGSKTLKLIRR